MSDSAAGSQKRAIATLTFCDGVETEAAGTAGLIERSLRREQKHVVQLLGDRASSGPRLVEDVHRARDSAPAVSPSQGCDERRMLVVGWTYHNIGVVGRKHVATEI